MERIVRLGKCLTDPISVRLVSMLRAGELCACEVAAVLSCTLPLAKTRLDRVCLTGVARRHVASYRATYTLDPSLLEFTGTLFEFFGDESDRNTTLRRDREALRAALKHRKDSPCHQWRHPSDYDQLFCALDELDEDAGGGGVVETSFKTLWSSDPVCTESLESHR